MPYHITDLCGILVKHVITARKDSRGMRDSTHPHLECYQYRVTLQHIAGFRGALLSFTPFLLLLSASSAFVLVSLVINNWIWYFSFVPITILFVALYLFIYRQRQQTQFILNNVSGVVRIATPFLGNWKYPTSRLVGIEAYTSDSKRTRQKDVAIRVIGFFAVVVFFVYFQSYIIAMMLLVLAITFYPLSNTNQPSITKSGIIMYFSKYDRHKPYLNTTLNLHVCADDTTIEHIKQHVMPHIQQ